METWRVTLKPSGGVTLTMVSPVFWPSSTSWSDSSSPLPSLLGSRWDLNVSGVTGGWRSICTASATRTSLPWRVMASRRGTPSAVMQDSVCSSVVPRARTSLDALNVQLVQGSPATVTSPLRSTSPAAAAASSDSGDGAWVSGPGMRRVEKPTEPWEVLKVKRWFWIVAETTAPPGGGPSRCSSSPLHGSPTWTMSVAIIFWAPAVSSTRYTTRKATARGTAGAVTVGGFGPPPEPGSQAARTRPRSTHAPGNRIRMTLVRPYWQPDPNRPGRTV